MADSNTSAVKLSLNLNNGVVSGSFLHPWAGTTNALHGVVLKRAQALQGQFLAGQQTGALDANAAPFLVTQSVVNVTLPALAPLLSEGGLLRFEADGVVTFTNAIKLAYNMSLDANGHLVVLSGGGTTRLFEVQTNVSFTASGITFGDGRNVGTNGPNTTAPQPGGDGCGAGILNLGGILSLTNCVLTNFFAQGGDAGVGPPTINLAPGGRGLGAAICSLGGRVTLASCQLADNVAVGGQGNADQAPGMISRLRGAALGGGIFSDGADCEIQGTTFARNEARGGDARLLASGGFTQAGDGAGGAIAIARANLHLAASLCASNTAAGPGCPTNCAGAGSGHGGALFLETNAVALLEQTSFGENLALGGGSELSGNAAQGRGGAVFNGGALELRGCAVRFNTAQGGSSNPSGQGLGGGVASLGSLILNACTLNNNLAEGGNGADTSTNGVMASGAPGTGGGIYSMLGSLAATNSTWASNSARGGSGANGSVTNAGRRGDGVGGALAVASNNAVLVNVTMAFNQAQPGTTGATNSGAGIGGGVLNSNATLLLLNSILAGNAPVNAAGGISDSGYNLSSDASLPLFGNGSRTNTDPLLGPLTTNGGPTLTMTLLRGSPALDAIPNTNSLPPVDQIGTSRPQGLAGDIGAVEVVPTLPVFTISPQSASVRFNTNVTFHSLALGPAPLGYFWIKNGAPFPSATNADLALTAVQAGDAGTYAAVATNSFGASTSLVAILTVDASPHISAQPQDATVPPAGLVSFVVGADGPALTYTWLHDGQPIPGATNTTYSINSAGPGIQGGYQVIVTNSFGAITSRVATLTFNSSVLSILTPPQSLTVAVGAPATFSVVVSNIASVGYQWLFASAASGSSVFVPLPNATNSALTIASATTNDAGSYSVVVSNAYSILTSQPAAQLTVLPRPTLSMTRAGANLSITLTGKPGSTARLLCATNLSSSAIWTPVATNTVTDSGFVTWPRTVPASGSVYYQAVSP